MSEYGSEWHEPVLVDEVLAHLKVSSSRRYIDGTLGGGGHTRAILDASAPDGEVLAIDRDPSAIEFARERLDDYRDRIRFVEGNYGDVARHAAGFGPVDGFLVDAGVSSRQLDDAERGFTFREAGPLDMRMGPDAPTLAEFLEETDESHLAHVLRKYGEVQKGSRRVARAVLQAWERGEIETTAELASVVEDAVPRGAGSGRRTKIHPATLVFQALRIAINRELEALEQAVEAIPSVVKAGGRAVFITFHSLEDRVVKHGFRELAADDLPAGLPVRADEVTHRANVLTGRPVTASDEEVRKNPRARSAKLRAIEVL